MTEPYERPQDPPPYPQAYPPPGYVPYGYYYPPPPPPGMVRPPNYLAWAIVTVFLFWPIAIAAIIKSNSVDRLWAEGQYGMAQEASNTTKTLCLVATILAGVLFLAVIALWFMLFAMYRDSVPPFPR